MTVDPDLLRSAETTLYQCMGLAENEKVLIIVNPPQLRIGEALFQAAKTRSENIRLVAYPEGSINGEEPPSWVAEQMAETDVAVAATEKSISHTHARRNASKKGARIASMPGITEDLFKRGLAADYDEIEEMSLKLKPYFDNASEAHITSPGGTDLTVKMGNKASVSIGKMLSPGDFTNLPDGETECAPKGAEGVLVVDRCGEYIKGPTALTFRNGHVVDIEDSPDGRRFSDLLTSAKKKDGGENASYIAEFAIGTNKSAIVSGIILEDEKVYGTCHIAVGDNTSYDGGTNESVLHIDMIVFKPTIRFDDILIMENGELCI